MYQRPISSSDFLQYLAAYMQPNNNGNDESHLPSINEISKELGVSVSTLREQLEVARALGLVDVRPRTGIRKLSYSFLPAVRQSLTYAIDLDPSNFKFFSDLRNQVEASFWNDAVRRLVEEDRHQLQTIMEGAWAKLNGVPIQIPHNEHRQLHTIIFSRLENPFVYGILESYWEAYEALGLAVYADYAYLKQVWTYHQQMVDSINKFDYEAGYRALVAHKDLLFHRSEHRNIRAEISFMPVDTEE